MTPNARSYIIKTQTNVRGDYMNTRNRRRKKQQLQLTLVLTGILFVLFIILFIQLSSNTVIGSKDISMKYVSVEVLAQDTLWDIGTEFINENYFDIHDYIEEIISINGLTSETIYVGQRITVPIVVEHF